MAIATIVTDGDAVDDGGVDDGGGDDEERSRTKVDTSETCEVPTWKSHSCHRAHNNQLSGQGAAQGQVDKRLGKPQD